MIEKIDFQLYNYCNRSCDFCPPFKKYRPSCITYLDYDVFKNTIDNISKCNSINNRLQIALSRYCEPLFDIEYMIKTAKYTKLVLPECELSIHTNGDYLNKDNIDSLYLFDIVYVNLYDKNLMECLDFLSKITKCDNIKIIHSESKIVLHIKNTKFNFNYNRKNTLNIRNRAGSINPNMHVERKTCGLIGKLMMVDYNGDVYPCCDTLSMIPQHKDMKCGNITDDGFNQVVDNIKNFKINKKICSMCNTNYSNIL